MTSPYSPVVERAGLRDRVRSRLDAKLVKYAGVSVIAVLVTQIVLISCNTVLDWSFAWSNVTAVSLGCIPSYTLNRYWVWGKRGKNHFWREVFPFWAMALLGLLFSTVLVALADRWSDSPLALSAANLTAFGGLWVVKFLVLDSILFKIVEAELGPEAEPASEAA